MICQDDSAFHGYLNGQLGSAVPSHLLKYGFCNKSFRKDEPLTSLTLLQNICPHFWAGLLLYSAITPKSEDKHVVKAFNRSEVHLSEMTCYKIHTLGLIL